MPDEPFERPRFCSRCGQPIVVAGASFCKDCGAPLTVAWLSPEPGFKPLVAVALSFIPGLGHVYRRRPMRGMLWFFGVSVAYTAGFGFGLLIHMICAANAALSGAIREDAFLSGRRRRARRFPAPFDSGR